MSLRFVLASCFSVSAALLLVPACSSAPPPSPKVTTRESGQSNLVESTFAGKNRCNPQEHERPFVVEWDATDISSFQARAATDVVFVRYEGCKLTIVDTCSDDSVRGALGSYRAIDWTSGSVERVDIKSSTELYAKLPLGVGLIGSRVASGEQFKMEYYVTGTRSATRPAVYTSEIQKIPGCAGVTHFVYAVNLGAFALATQSAQSAAATQRASDVEKKAGEIAACRGETARESDLCKVPIRLTLREITAGEAPDAQAARAPETPSALNLAGKLEARSATEREAGEHMAAAQMKLAAGDGKGCVTELDAHDRLDARPAGLSTNPKGGLRLRALCTMAAGQCDAGKEMARRAWQADANSSQVKGEEIDRRIDGDVASYCRGGKMSDRDKVLVALRTMDDRAAKQTPAQCRAAYETAAKLAPGLPVRDNYDMLYDSAHRIAMNAPACFARAGDCASAWQVAKEMDIVRAKARGATSTPSGQRGSMMSATYDLCLDKDQGKLTDVEQVHRAVAELKQVHSAKPPTVAYCTSRIEQGSAALKRALPSDANHELRFQHGYIAEEGAKCLEMAGDCAAAWRLYAETNRAFRTDEDKTSSNTYDWSLRRRFRENVRACTNKPQGTMSTRDTLFWAASTLEASTRDKVEPSACMATYEAAKRANATVGGDKSINSEWNYATRDIPRDIGQCIQKSTGDCKRAYALFKEAESIFTVGSSSAKGDEKRLRSSFEMYVPDCKGK